MDKEHIIAGGSVLTIYRGGDGKVEGFEIKSGKVPGNNAPEPPQQPVGSVRERFLAGDFEILKDGAGGNLWKDSETPGRGVVVLFDPEYGDEPGEEFRSVKAYNRKGALLADFEFSGFANADAGRLRQHWRTSKKAGDFPRVVLIEADGQLFKVQNAKRRVD